MFFTLVDRQFYVSFNLILLQFSVFIDSVVSRSKVWITLCLLAKFSPHGTGSREIHNGHNWQGWHTFHSLWFYDKVLNVYSC